MVNNYKVLKTVYKSIHEIQGKLNKQCGFPPIDVEIRLNWECNAKCQMCGLKRYIKESDDSRKIKLKKERVIFLLDELKWLGCQSVTFSGGEPTLCDYLEDMVCYASQACDMEVSINTNGYLLDAKRTLKLLQNGVSGITFSVLSPEAYIHNKIMGMGYGLEHIKDSIDLINRYNWETDKKVKILINNVVLRNNILSFKGYGEFYEEHRFDYLTFSPASINTRWDEWTADNEKLRPTIEQVRELKKDIIPYLNSLDWCFKLEDPYGNTNEEIERNLHTIFFDRSKKCYVTMLHTVIQSNGDVIPCCYAPDTFILGNIHEEPFHEIWEGNKYKQIRKKINICQYDMCLSCRQYKKINETIENKLEKRNEND